MVLTSLADLSASQKEDLVASLSGLIVGSTDEVTAEKLQAVATASGNSVSAPMAALFAKVLTSAEKGVESYTPGPGGGGGGGGEGGGGDGGAAVAEVCILSFVSCGFSLVICSVFFPLSHPMHFLFHTLYHYRKKKRKKKRPPLVEVICSEGMKVAVTIKQPLHMLLETGGGIFGCHRPLLTSLLYSFLT